MQHTSRSKSLCFNRKALYTFAFALLCVGNQSTWAGDIKTGGEYFIISDYYNKVLGTDAEGSETPALSTYGTVTDNNAYIFVAEASSSDGYYLLRNKATGKYLTASTSNSWSLVWKDTKGTSDEYLWKLDVQMGRSITSKRNTGKQLGSDWSESDFVKVYYNKSANSLTRFTVVPVSEVGLDASLTNAHTSLFTNEIGRQEQDFYQVTEAVTAEKNSDLHIVSSTPFAVSGSVNLPDASSWLILEGVTPSEAIDQWLDHITIGGAKAQNGTNVRVAIYLDGAAVIPTRANDAAITAYSEPGLTGTTLKLRNQNYKTLNAYNNRIRSLVLKRGYMAILYSGQGESGYSRVYVADHADLILENLPEALDRRISSIHIKPWQYTAKKGWCSTQSNSGIADGAAKMKASWFYTWSADRNSTANCEYVPIRQHIYWPSIATIASKEASTHVLSFNEPDHPEQHKDCDCGSTISAWTATTKTPEMTQTGMRIGSPAPTDLSWLTEYAGHVDDMAYRCDFVALHAYWGPNEANGAQAWYNRLKDVYDKTGRPIWITEWAYGASWTTEKWPSGYGDQLEKNRAAIFDIVNMLESCPFVERYAYYQWDTSSRRFINDDGWITPAGRVYRNTKSTFAYNKDVQRIPNWWKPSAKVTGLQISTVNDDVQFSLSNTNGDCTESIVLERLQDGTWTTLNKWDERPDFDNETLTFSLPKNQINRFSDRFRVTTTTLYGVTTTGPTTDYGYIVNPDCTDGTNGWTVSNLSTNSGEAADGDKSNTYWDQWKANGLQSSMEQNINNLPEGSYTASVLVRASKGVDITLTATITDAQEQTRTVEAHTVGTGNSSPEGSAFMNGWEELSLTEPFSIHANETLQLKLSAQGSGSAWWSADDFRLQYKGDVAIDRIECDERASYGPESMTNTYTVDGQKATQNTTGIIIQNGKKKLRK